MDALLHLFGHLWTTTNAALHDTQPSNHDLYRFLNDALALEQALASWQDSQISDFRPWEIGSINDRQDSLGDEPPEVGFWPGRVDMYFDFSVAGVWNVSRTARLLLIELAQKLFERLDGNEKESGSYVQSGSTVRLTQDLISSIPFHIVEDVHSFVGEASKSNTPQSGTPSTNSFSQAPINSDLLNPTFPGRRAGGLFLVHPLYVASNLEVVPQTERAYFRRCLDWIAMYMGIGLASVFGKVSRYHFRITISRSSSLLRPVSA